MSETETPPKLPRNRVVLFVDYFKVFQRVADERCRAFYHHSDLPNGHAASFEGLSTFAGLLKKLGPEATILDAGAGVSSAILRSYFKNVTTCDPDENYLSQVRRVCVEMGLSHGVFIAGVPKLSSFDACFYDYGQGERVDLMPEFFRMTSKFFWADDTNAKENRDALVALCGEQYEVVDAPGSIDEFNRSGSYAWIK